MTDGETKFEEVCGPCTSRHCLHLRDSVSYDEKQWHIHYHRADTVAIVRQGWRLSEIGFLSPNIEKCGKRLYIDFGSYFSQLDAEIHHDVFISTYCIIGNIIIGSNVGVSPNSHILSGRRQHASCQTDVAVLWQSGGLFEQITIGENSWIGQASVVMTDIGKQNIIGAGSVVVKKTGDYEVHAGNPACLLRRLF